MTLKLIIKLLVVVVLATCTINAQENQHKTDWSYSNTLNLNEDTQQEKKALSDYLESISIDPVVVTATRFPSAMDKTGNTIRVITKKELLDLGIRSLDESLALVSNVATAKSGGLNTLFMRGAHSGATKVLVNGIALNDPISPNGQPIIDSLPFSSIDRIEVVSGAKGTVHGAASQGGVINIITNQSVNGLSAGVEYSPDSYLANASVASQINTVRLSLNALYEEDDSESVLVNTSEHDEKKLQSVSFSIENQVDATKKVSAFYTYNNLHQDLDNSTSDDLNYYVSSDQHLGSIEFNWIASSKLSTKGGYTKTSTQRAYSNLPDSSTDVNARDAEYKSDIDTFFVNSQYRINKNRNIITGLDIVNEQGSFIDNGTSQWGAYQSNQGNEDQTRTGVFLQFYNQNRFISSQVGSRLEYYGNQKSIMTYSVSLFNLVPVIDTHLLVNFRSGYRPGSIYERFNSSYGNNDLKAETSLSTEYAMLKELKFSDIKLSYFKNYTDNAISFNNATFKYYNSDQKTHAEGWEFSLTSKPYKALKFIRLDLMSLIAKDAEGNTELRRPEHKATLSFALNLDPVTLGVSLIALGKRVDQDPQTFQKVSMPSFAYANAKLTYELNNSSNIYLKLYNLTNTQYEITKGYNGRNRQIYLGYEKRF